MKVQKQAIKRAKKDPFILPEKEEPFKEPFRNRSPKWIKRRKNYRIL